MPPERAPEPDTDSPAGIPLAARCIATGCFAGYVPWASGTVGTAVGVLLYLIPGIEQPLVFIPLIALAIALGVPSAARVARVAGHRLTPTAARTKEIFQGEGHVTPDPSIVVIDEVIGMWISLLLLPKTVAVVAMAFVLFRLFDIVKPEPARMLEKLPNGWGIILDDVVAGVYANLSCRVLIAVAGLLLPQFLP